MTFRFMTAHLDAVDESYTEHFRFAMRFGASMIIGGLACMLHGILPFCCTTSGSRRIRNLHATLANRPARRLVSRQAFTPEEEFCWSI